LGQEENLRIFQSETDYGAERVGGGGKTGALMKKIHRNIVGGVEKAGGVVVGDRGPEKRKKVR